MGNLRNRNLAKHLPKDATGTYSSVGSTGSGYSGCLDSAIKRDLLRSLSLPNRMSLSSSTNARILRQDMSATEGIKGTLFFLAKHASQRRNGINAAFPRFRLEGEFHVIGAKVDRWELEKIPGEDELRSGELCGFSSLKTRATDLDPTER